jgi:hypothetical protein
MKGSMLFKSHVLLGVTVCAVLLCSGCQKIRSLFIKKPVDQIVSESYGVRIMGYEQTVTVRATPKELSDLLNDPQKMSTIMFSGVGDEDALTSSEPLEPTRTGTCFPADIKIMGVEIPGQLIVTRVEEDRMLWILWDNPYMFQIQRWDTRPIREGTRLTMRLDTEIPRRGMLAGLVDVLGLMGLVDEPLKAIDLMLAKIQAYFDPSLAPEELVAVGIRGEIYDALFQVHEARTWIDAQPEEVLNWATKAENGKKILGELTIDEYHFTLLEKAAIGETVYAPSLFEAGLLKAKIDLFTVKKQDSLRMYYSGLGQMGFIEFQAEPENGGSLVTARITMEIPGPLSPQSMEQLMFATGVPKMLLERLIIIKTEVEKTG